MAGLTLTLRLGDIATIDGPEQAVIVALVAVHGERAQLTLGNERATLGAGERHRWPVAGHSVEVVVVAVEPGRSRLAIVAPKNWAIRRSGR